MSKIERALRKAEEEKRKKAQAEPMPEALPVELPAGVTIDTSETDAVGKYKSENFQKIAAKLKSYYESVGPTDVIFTSAVSGEGKTTSAINCAISLCRNFNLSVCLVDCDLRNPEVSAHFDMNGTVGVVEALKGTVEIESIIQPTNVRGLSVVCSSRPERVTLPLLNSRRLKRIVEELRARFDFIIFDSCPVLPVADTVVLSKCVSGVVLIIESGKTRRKHVEQVFEQIDRDKVIGFIMNHKKYRMPRTYDYRKYYNYYGDK